MAVVVLIVVVIIVAVTVIEAKEKKKSTGYGESSDKKIELDKSTPSTIHFSDEFKSKELVTKADGNHTITTIYMSKEDSFIWICPNCETENPSSKGKCCVCHYVK